MRDDVTESETREAPEPESGAPAGAAGLVESAATVPELAVEAIDLSRPRAEWPWGGFVLALGLHSAFIGALLFVAKPNSLGGGTVLDAIEVAVVDGRALEALFRPPTDAVATPPSAPIARDQGSPEPEPEQAAAPDRAAVRPLPREEPSVSSTPIESAPRGCAFFCCAVGFPPPDEGVVPVIPPPPEPQRDPEPEREPEPPLPEVSAAPSQAADAHDAQAEGGVATSGWETATIPSTAAAAAPPGAVRDYARLVMRELARNRPRPQGLTGTTHVRFTVAQNGSIESARVLTSSGHAILDNAALAAVRSTRLPAPPATLPRRDPPLDLLYYFL